MQHIKIALEQRSGTWLMHLRCLTSGLVQTIRIDAENYGQACSLIQRDGHEIVGGIPPESPIRRVVARLSAAGVKMVQLDCGHIVHTTQPRKQTQPCWQCRGVAV